MIVSCWVCGFRGVLGSVWGLFGRSDYIGIFWPQELAASWRGGVDPLEQGGLLGVVGVGLLRSRSEAGAKSRTSELSSEFLQSRTLLDETETEEGMVHRVGREICETPPGDGGEGREELVDQDEDVVLAGGRQKGSGLPRLEGESGNTEKDASEECTSREGGEDPPGAGSEDSFGGNSLPGVVPATMSHHDAARNYYYGENVPVSPRRTMLGGGFGRTPRAHALQDRGLRQRGGDEDYADCLEIQELTAVPQQGGGPRPVQNFLALMGRDEELAFEETEDAGDGDKPSDSDRRDPFTPCSPSSRRDPFSPCSPSSRRDPFSPCSPRRASPRSPPRSPASPRRRPGSPVFVLGGSCSPRTRQFRRGNPTTLLRQQLQSMERQLLEVQKKYDRASVLMNLQQGANAGPFQPVLPPERRHVVQTCDAKEAQTSFVVVAGGDGRSTAAGIDEATKPRGSTEQGLSPKSRLLVALRGATARGGEGAEGLL